MQLLFYRALPAMREQMQKLLKSGRFEIATGGWVMTDEANAHLFSMVTQLIEGIFLFVRFIGLYVYDRIRVINIKRTIILQGQNYVEVRSLSIIRYIDSRNFIHI